MTDTIDRQIDKLLEEHAPEGTLWVVVDNNDMGRAYGPFDTYAEAHDWLYEGRDFVGSVYPLFQP